VPATAEQSVAPGINDEYKNADPQQWREIFENDGREIWACRLTILNALHLQPGMHVADVGAGTGFFSLMFAKQVAPTGRVYAVDITPNFVASIAERAAQAGISNIQGVVNTPREVLLPESSVDMVFISDTYHHFEYPISTLASIHKALKPNGELVIVDYRLFPGNHFWLRHHVRAGEKEVQQEIETAGFELVNRMNLMRTQYFLRFRKKN
jgi:ubiquinone/menaquinone biosynthesis C-methylase UbiE